MDKDPAPGRLRFGDFELDPEAGELLKGGRRLKMQPQPFKLLALLASRAGTVVTREDIRRALWADGTFVDFDQAVNFTIKQIRDALRDSAERPQYIETVPRRGYRFIAPLEAPSQGSPADLNSTTVRLQKALWTNIAELRVAEARRHRQMVVIIAVLSVALLSLIGYLILRA